MTIQEAKTILETETKHHPEISIFFESLEVATEALEKQIPKPVLYKDQHSHFSKEDWLNRDHYNCPICLRRLRNKQKDDYCPKCGQKLDWGKQE